jgi:hypothetical protein
MKAASLRISNVFAAVADHEQAMPEGMQSHIVWHHQHRATVQTPRQFCLGKQCIPLIVGCRGQKLQ